MKEIHHYLCEGCGKEFPNAELCTEHEEKCNKLVQLVCHVMTLEYHTTSNEFGFGWNSCPVSCRTTEKSQYFEIIDDGWGDSASFKGVQTDYCYLDLEETDFGYHLIATSYVQKDEPCPTEKMEKKAAKYLNRVERSISKMREFLEEKDASKD